MFMGTPGYLAPEVIEGELSGPASDVHSWGATVAFAATGRAPYGSGAFETIFYRIVNGQPDLGGFPVPLLDLVARALSRDPVRRPAAAELVLRTSALDPASLVPSALQVTAMPRGLGSAPAGLAGGLPGLAQPGTVIDGQAPAALAGAAGAMPVAVRAPVLPPTLPGPAAPVAGNGRAPNGYGDVLPPVRYAPGAPPPASRGADGVAGRRTGHSPAGRLLVAGCVVVAVAVSVAFPVAGTVGSLIGLVGLRAIGRTAGRLSSQLSRRGFRVGDPVLAVFMFPASLAWSVIRTLLLAPMALVMGVLAALITLGALPQHPIPEALAFGAGALVAFYFLGPGSGGSRKPLRKLFDVVAGTPISAAVAVAVVGAAALAVVTLAASHPPFFWPAGNLTAWLQHFNWISHLGHSIRSQVLRLFGRPVPAGG